MQFGRFLGDLASGDLGESIRKSRPALEVVLEAMPTTLKLAGITMGLALALAIVVGSLAAYRPGGLFDRVACVLSLLGASAPDFWIAISGILLFAVTLGWLPTSGMGPPVYWIMPIGVLLDAAVRPARPGGARRHDRRALLGLRQDGARQGRAARSASSSSTRCATRCWPVITVAGDQAAGIINGAVIVETVFGFPGVGKLMIDAIIQRDFAIVQAAIIVTAAAIFILNILIDIAYAVLDPRIRHH